MKITWITRQHEPDTGGMAVSSARIVNSLKDKGHSVKVIHLTAKPEKMFEKADDKRSTYHKWVSHQITGVHLPMQPQFIFELFREEMQNSIIIGFGGDFPGYLATLWAKWLDTKSIVLFRGNDFDKALYDGKSGHQVLYNLEHADVVGAVTTQMVRRIKALRKGVTVFTPNSIDIREYELFPSDFEKNALWLKEQKLTGKKIVGMIGKLKQKKGLDIALYTFQTCGLKDKAHLVSVGDVPDVYEEYYNTAPFWTKVPFQKKDDIIPFYGLMDVIFIPSYAEGMPNVLLEAMAVGSLIVGSKAGAIPDVITHGENGFLFDIGDARGAFECIQEALSLGEDDKKRFKMNALSVVTEKLTRENELKPLETFIEQWEKEGVC